MKVRAAIGRRIISVNQARTWNAEYACWLVEVYSFELDNGSRIVFHAVETCDCPAVEATVIKARRREGK